MRPRSVISVGRMSRRFGLDFLGDFRSDGLLRDFQIVSKLQVQPALYVAAEVAHQAHRGIHADAAPLQDDVVDARSRNAQRPGKRVGAHTQGLEEFLKPLGMSANALARALRVPASRINDIVLQRRGVSVDTAMRLVRYFGGDVQSWLNLQLAYDLKVAQKTIASKIAKEVEPKAA